MQSDRLSATFSAVSDPTRRAIPARPARGNAVVGQLAKPFNISPPAISRHLRVLENAGLIERGRRAQWRPCRIDPAPLRQATEWLEYYRRFWDESFDKLEEFVSEIRSPGG